MPQFKRLRLIKSDTTKKFAVYHIYEHVFTFPDGKSIWKVWDYRDEKQTKVIEHIQRNLKVFLRPDQINNLMTGMTAEIEFT